MKRMIRRATLFAMLVGLACAVGQQSDQDLSRKTAAVHAAVLTVDTHIDWPSRQLRDSSFVPGERHETGKPGSGQWDLIRMKEGGLDAVFMSIFTAQGPRNAEGHANAKAHAIKLIEITKKLVADYPDLAEIALTPEDAYRIEQAGKRAIFMGMENGYPIGTDLGNVKMFYDLGVRYITLSHSRNNEICDSSTDTVKQWGGLGPFGEQVVKEMNRLGIMVDLSHVHDEAFWDAVALSIAPVIASHSSARSLCDHARNMNDEMLKAVKQNGGVVQVCLLGEFIKKMPSSPERQAALEPLRSRMTAWRRGELSDEQAQSLWEEYQTANARFPANRPTLQDAVDHIDHMVKVMGIDHVGMGSDFDGGGGLIGIDDVSQMPALTREMLQRGYSESDIQKIWGGNLMRVFKEVIRVASKLQSDTSASR